MHLSMSPCFGSDRVVSRVEHVRRHRAGVRLVLWREREHVGLLLILLVLLLLLAVVLGTGGRDTVSPIGSFLPFMRSLDHRRQL